MPEADRQLWPQLPPVSVVVLNYNTCEHLDACFMSLRQLLYPEDRLEVILVDNASTDGSAAYTRANFAEVKQVINEQNYGFSKGNNIGAEKAAGELVAFLNPDMRVDRRWLIEAVKPFLAEAEVAAVGSKILSWDGKSVDFAGGAANFYGYGYQAGLGQAAATDLQQAPILFACGGAMVAQRRVFLDAGGFDEDFFAYYEDVDLGWRLWVMGYKVILAPASVTYHRHHGAWKKVNQHQRKVLYERNAFFVMLKNYDEANLNRILPAAFMLLLKRIYLAAGVDDRMFRVGAPPEGPEPALTEAQDSNALTGSKQQFQAAWRILVNEGIGALAFRLRARLKGYRQSRLRARQPKKMRADSLVDGKAAVPLEALSYVVAGNDIISLYPEMLAKRQFVQARRRRPDRDILPLLQRPLDSSELWPEYRQAHTHLSRLLGIDQMFKV